MVKKSKANSGFTVNFEGVSEGFFTPHAGGYAFEVISAQLKEDDDEQLICEYKVLDGKHKGKTCRDYFGLGAKSLWRLRKMLTAAGFEVEDDEMTISFEDMVGLTFFCDVEEREYEGQRKANFVDFSALESSGEDEDEDDKPAAKKGKKDDEDDKPAAKKGKKDDEDDKPAAKKGKKGKKDELDKVSADSLAEMDEEELSELNERYNLEVDLDDFSTLRKKRAAVIGALEDKDLLED